ncbi:predicted protein [Histoplasma mississippiense (nom. inval.)]|uniref:predicted protein n=1 Tax=Ajellomyces capsulatus (strain NAm1 / WU24) TaxID=2059318 RepID=UPI000157D15C|nr:predicted protein [Histoplasma mississippiense (nom. inval.)]EDN10904.1 predicted protein [Histoplasma mississippiense (nom. inval.)]
MQALLSDETHLHSNIIELTQTAINAAENLIVIDADTSNVNILQNTVSAAVKSFTVKIHKIQQYNFYEISIETVTDEISVITSPVAALKSSLKHHTSSIEKIQSNKQICFDDNFLNDTDQAEMNLFFNL